MSCSIKKFILAIICLMLFTLSGCWNNKNLTELAIVVGIGLDKVENDEIEITVQLVKPSMKEDGKDKSWYTLSARGNTAFQANRNLLTKVNKQLNYSNTQMVVLGEKLAENGIGDVFDFIQRVHETDKRGLILISKGINPKELFNIHPVQEKASALEIVQTVKNTNRLASIIEKKIYNLILNISEENNPVIGIVKASGKSEKLEMSDLNFMGAAAFNKDKLIGWLNPNEAYGFSILDNKIKSPSIEVPNPINSEKNVTIEITKSKVKKDVLFNDDKPQLYVEVHAEGNMVEQHGKGDLTSAEQIRALEAEVSRQIEKIVNITIRDAQKNLQADIFGFGSIIHRKNLPYWNKIKNNWGNEFSNLPVDINVQYKNKNMGFIKKHE